MKNCNIDTQPEPPVDWCTFNGAVPTNFMMPGKNIDEGCGGSGGGGGCHCSRGNQGGGPPKPGGVSPAAAAGPI